MGRAPSTSGICVTSGGAILALFLLGCAQVQAQTPPSCVGQVDGRFLAHETDCWRYYTCVGGQAFPQECPSPYVFSETLQICDFGDRNACVSCPATGVKTLPVTGSCTKYILCIEGRQTQLECPAELQFDPAIGQCNVASIVNCLELNCPATDDPNNPVILPNPNNCREYFVCVRGEPQSLMCPVNTFFNPDKRACDLEANVPCANPPPTPQDDSVARYCINNQGMTHKPIPNDCQRYVTCLHTDAYVISCPPGKSFDRMAKVCMDTAEAECLIDVRSLCRATTAESMVTVAYPNSCSKYVLCVFGEAYEMQCASHELYDILTNRCVIAHEAHCDNYVPLLLLDDPKPFAEPCAGNVGMTNAPNPNNCREYYMCINTESRPMTCPGNQIFDIYSLSCRPVMHATCIRDVAPPPPVPSPPNNPSPAPADGPCAGNAGINYLPHPADCSRYYMCMDTQSIERNCAVGEVFDIYTKQCLLRSAGTCILDPPAPPPPEPTPAPTAATPAPTPAPPPLPTPPHHLFRHRPHHLFRHPPHHHFRHPPHHPLRRPHQEAVFYHPHPDCTRFFRCVWGTLHVLDCPPNQYWNQEREFCDHPFNVSCPGSSG
ncbi:hypothetical protein AND_006584 [Anopheles darlingi]|uniref:Chitin-binding type-2 domain-containing protein n=1 Tax=Anopheles darlingi TaxID=43151 RepID=W5JG05_ANODA|nr:hypothetical protein AND_006584 [Anopheles darlingi]